MFTKTVCGVIAIGFVLSFGGSHVRAIEKLNGVETLTVSEGPALPAGRASHAGGVVTGRIVVAGGTAWSADRLTKRWLSDSLVLTDGKWEPGPPLPHALSEPMFASDGKALFIAGGRRNAAETSDAVYRLGHVDGALAWSTLTKLPATLTAGAGGLLGGQLIVACGSTNDAPTNDTWALDVTAANATWRKRAPLPGPPRMYPAMVACGGSLYLFGGMRPTAVQGKRVMEVFKDAYRYDLKADAWERLGDLPARGYCWSGSAIDDENILLTGRADGAIHDDAWRVSVKEMRVANVGRTVIPATCAPLVAVGPDTWWLIGGEPDSNKTRTERVTVLKRVEK